LESFDYLVNGLKRLIESLQKKKLTDTWDDSFVIRETNVRYEIADTQRTEGDCHSIQRCAANAATATLHPAVFKDDSFIFQRCTLIAATVTF